jgi:DNA-binding Lrp family transcriptional regulator
LSASRLTRELAGSVVADREGAVVKAYVLIQVEPGKTGRVVEALARVRGVISVEGVTGPYDVVALAGARDQGELSRRVLGSIQAIEGIIRTLPCTVVRL